MIRLFFIFAIFTSPVWCEEPVQTALELRGEYADTPQEDYRKLFMKTTGMVVAVLALLILTFWFIRRFSFQRMGQMNQMTHIKIIEKRALSPKSMLYLLQIGGKQVLIAESQVSVNELSTNTQPQQRMGQPGQVRSLLSEEAD